MSLARRRACSSLMSSPRMSSFASRVSCELTSCPHRTHRAMSPTPASSLSASRFVQRFVLQLWQQISPRCDHSAGGELEECEKGMNLHEYGERQPRHRQRMMSSTFSKQLQCGTPQKETSSSSLSSFSLKRGSQREERRRRKRRTRSQQLNRHQLPNSVRASS